MVRGRSRIGRGHGSGRRRSIGKCRGSGRGLFSGEDYGNSQDRVEHREALVDDGLHATTPYVRRQS